MFPKLHTCTHTYAHTHFSMQCTRLQSNYTLKLCDQRAPASLSSWHAHTHAHTQIHARARARARTHTHTHVHAHTHARTSRCLRLQGGACASPARIPHRVALPHLATPKARRSSNQGQCSPTAATGWQCASPRCCWHRRAEWRWWQWFTCHRSRRSSWGRWSSWRRHSRGTEECGVREAREYGHVVPGHGV